MNKPLVMARSLKQQALSTLTLEERKGFLIVTEDIKYIIMIAISTFILASSLIFNNPYEILFGLRDIIFSPSVLVSDYFVIGNIGAALFNSGVLMLSAIYISYKNNVNMNGPIMAAVFTIGGFSFFGKNLLNVWPVVLGVFIYSLARKENFNKYLLIAFFGTALGPMVSQVSFGIGLNAPYSIALGVFLGVFAGFLLPPLANHFVSFHQGFNLYNIGFTCGIAGMFFMAILRAFNLESNTSVIVAEGFNSVFTIYLFVLFTVMLLVGIFFSVDSFKELGRLIKQPGRLVSDFVSAEGFSVSLVNMSLLGFLTTIYVLLVGGELNGPIIGGIFTVVGFGAFGKHIKNILPVLAGVFLASLLQIWTPTSTGALLAALFGTTLAPIAGFYGWKYGVIAGFIHMAVVMNVGYLHGGMNLYNNGFSGGFVAAVLVPIFDSLKSMKK
jgi:hypothetical protein